MLPVQNTKHHFESDTCSKTLSKTTSPPCKIGILAVKQGPELQVSPLEADTCRKNRSKPLSPHATIVTTPGSAASRYLELARPRTRVVAGGGRSCRWRCNHIATLVNFLQDTIKIAWRQNTYKSAIYAKWLSRNRDSHFT